MRTIKIFCFLFICFIVKAQTEKNIDHQSMLWTRYQNQLTISPKWLLQSEFDNRIFIDPTQQNSYVFRTQGRYKIINNVEVGAGYAYFSTATQDPHITHDFSVPEYRGQQDITWIQNLNSNIITHQRFQVEERFIHNSNKEELLSGTSFSWRFRYRLQGEFTCWRKEQQHLKAIIYDELMINAGENIVKNTFDQNRFYAAVQYGATKNIALELGYLKSFQQRSNGIDYYDRDIIRFTLLHKINLKGTQRKQTN